MLKKSSEDVLQLAGVDGAGHLSQLFFCAARATTATAIRQSPEPVFRNREEDWPRFFISSGKSAPTFGKQNRAEKLTSSSIVPSLSLIRARRISVCTVLTLTSISSANELTVIPRESSLRHSCSRGVSEAISSGIRIARTHTAASGQFSGQSHARYRPPIRQLASSCCRFCSVIALENASRYFSRSFSGT